jgi:hypothetical protein
MTASNISVTAGSGTRLATNSYTEGAVTVHDEKVILGEPYLPSYVVSGSASTATINSHLLQIMAGASLRVRIRRIEIAQYQLATTAAIMDLILVRLSTAGTGGSSVAANPLDPASSASGAAARQGLTASMGTEGVFVGGGNAYLMQTAGASTPQVQPLWVWDFDGPRVGPLIIAAGTANGIAVKNLTAHAGAGVRVNVWFDESSF